MTHDLKRRARDPFEFQLAMILGRTIGELRDSISNEEYVAWKGYAGWQAWQAANGK